LNRGVRRRAPPQRIALRVRAQPQRRTAGAVTAAAHDTQRRCVGRSRRSSNALPVTSAARADRFSPPSSAFTGFRFSAEVIVVAVRSLRYGLSYRDVRELLAARGSRSATSRSTAACSGHAALRTRARVVHAPMTTAASAGRFDDSCACNDVSAERYARVLSDQRTSATRADPCRNHRKGRVRGSARCTVVVV
jgi:hypothetical protein